MPEGILTWNLFHSLHIFAVICLSDDDDGDDDDDDCIAAINTPVPTPEKPPQQQTSDNAEENGSRDVNCSSNWTIEPTDTVSIPNLPSKYSDLYKKPFEIRCSAIRFGIVEFNVDCEVIAMKDVEFEMRLQSNRTRRFDHPFSLYSFRRFPGHSQYQVGLFRYDHLLLFLSIENTGGSDRSAQRICRSFQSVHSDVG